MRARVSAAAHRSSASAGEGSDELSSMATRTASSGIEDIAACAACSGDIAAAAAACYAC